MVRFISLLLFIGLAWGQADLDKLVLKDGTTHFGDLVSYSTKTVIFVSGGVQYSRPISMVARLVLEDGRVLIKNILSLEEYQKLSTEEKGIYDAKSKNLGKWYLFGPMSTILFGGCVLLKDYFNKKQGLKKDMTRLESPIFLGGSLAASLTIPYFVFNRKEKINFPKSILTDSEKEIYKQTYSKKLRQRKFRYAAVSTTVSVVIVAVAVASFDLDMSGGFGGGGNWGMGGYSGP
jgi:hypothetical protein